jgi:hypothetical protein
VEKGNLEHLSDVLVKLYPANLNTVLTDGNNEALAALVSTAERGNFEDLSEVLVTLNSANLKAVLTDRNNRALAALVGAVEKGKPEHLVKVLGRLGSADLNAVLTDGDNGALAALARASKDLVEMLCWINYTDLVEVLKIRVNNKAIGEHVKDNLNNLDFYVKQKFITALKEAGFPD